MMSKHAFHAYAGRNRSTGGRAMSSGIPTQTRKAKFVDDATETTFEEEADTTIDSSSFGWFHDLDDAEYVAEVPGVVGGEAMADISLEDGWSSPQNTSAAELKFWLDGTDNAPMADSPYEMDVTPIPFGEVATKDDDEIASTEQGQQKSDMKDAYIPVVAAWGKKVIGEEGANAVPVELAEEAIDLTEENASNKQCSVEVWEQLEETVTLLNESLRKYSQNNTGYADVKCQMSFVKTKVNHGTWNPRQGASWLLLKMWDILHTWDINKKLNENDRKESWVQDIGRRMAMVEIVLYNDEQLGKKLAPRNGRNGGDGEAVVNVIGYVGEPETFADDELSESDTDSHCSMNDHTDTESPLSYLTESDVYKTARRRHEQVKFTKRMKRHYFGIMVLPEMLKQKALYAITQSRIAIEDRGYTADDAWDNVQSTMGKLRTNCELRKLLAEMTFGSDFDG